MDGWNTTFLLGRPIFRGYVSFREGKGPPRVFFSTVAQPQEIRNQAMAEGDVERERMRMAKTQDRMVGVVEIDGCCRYHLVAIAGMFICIWYILNTYIYLHYNIKIKKIM